MSSKRKQLSTKDEKSCDKRAKESGRNYIDTLPEELLCMVFDRLCLHSVKIASLVCRKWNEILFSGTYAKRFVFRVDSEVDYELHDPMERIVEAIHVLARSKRGYRRLSFKGGDYDNEEEFQEVWDSYAKPILRSNSVKHLHVECQFRIWVDMPNLETYDGPLSALHRHDDSVPLPALTNLKHVTLHRHEDYSVSPNEDEKTKESHFTAIRRFTNVESMKWKLALSNDMFLALCETCTKVKDLLFYRALCVQSMADLDHLSKLTHLRSLKFKDDSIVVVDKSSYDFDFSKQINLVELDLCDTDMDVLKISKSVRSLSIYITAENEQTLMHSIASCGTELTKLKLMYGGGSEFISKEPTITLKALPNLKNLETLVFVGVHFKDNSFLSLDAPMDSVRKIQLKNCYLDTKQILGIKEKFPNLKELKFLNSEYLNNI